MEKKKEIIEDDEGNLHVKGTEGNSACWELEFNWVWSREGSIEPLRVTGKKRSHKAKMEKEKERSGKGVGRVPLWEEKKKKEQWATIDKTL